MASFQDIIAIIGVILAFLFILGLFIIGVGFKMAGSSGIGHTDETRKNGVEMAKIGFKIAVIPGILLGLGLGIGFGYSKITGKEMFGAAPEVATTPTVNVVVNAGKVPNVGKPVV